MRLVEDTRAARSILCSSPTSIKSVLLKLIDLGLKGPEIGCEADIEKLKKIMQIFLDDAVAIFDEVDVILHPLKSELTFTLGKKEDLDDSCQWLIPEFLARAILGKELPELPKDNKTAVDLQNFFISEILTTKYSKYLLQHSRELLDINAYSHGKPSSEPPLKAFKQHIGELLVFYLQHFYRESKIELQDFLKSNFDNLAASIHSNLLCSIDPEFPNLAGHIDQCKKWCQHLLPHIWSQKHRVNYGLSLQCGDSISDRMFRAVPFEGKDKPSLNSDFSSIDVAFGFTALSFMKTKELDCIHIRKLYQHFLREWIVADFAEQRHLEQEWKTFFPDGECVYNNLKDLLADSQQIHIILHQHLKSSESAKLYYIRQIILPAMAWQYPRQISADSLDLCNMFSSILGFSGTPSKTLYPTAWDLIEPFEATMNIAQEEKVEKALCSLNDEDFSGSAFSKNKDENVQLFCFQPKEGADPFSSDWSVENLLNAIADSPFDSSGSTHFRGSYCFIDCGALVTGFGNEDVAAFFMKCVSNAFFHARFQACVYWDQNDEPVALQRGGGGLTPVPIASCSVPKTNWFVYFDHIHTTGTDIRLPRSSFGIVTISGDTILRDYVQACWRLRQLGEGQQIRLLLAPQICRLVVNEVLRKECKDGEQCFSDDAPTLTVFEQHNVIEPVHIYKFLENHQETYVLKLKRILLDSERRRLWGKRAIYEMSNLLPDEANHWFEKFVHNVPRPSLVDSAVEVKLNESEKECEAVIQKKNDDMPPCSPRFLHEEHQKFTVREKEQEKLKEKERESHALWLSPTLPKCWQLQDIINLAASEEEQKMTLRKGVFCRVNLLKSKNILKGGMPWYQLNFFPDHIFASTYLWDLSRAARAIVQVIPKDAAKGIVVLLTLEEADTMSRILTEHAQDKVTVEGSEYHLNDIVTLHVLDLEGYRSDVVPSGSTKEGYAPCSSDFIQTIRMIDLPTRVEVGLAFARLFNCERDYNFYQTVCILEHLHSLHVDIDRFDILIALDKLTFSTIYQNAKNGRLVVCKERTPVFQSGVCRSRFLQALTSCDVLEHPQGFVRWREASKLIVCLPKLGPLNLKLVPTRSVSEDANMKRLFMDVNAVVSLGCQRMYLSVFKVKTYKITFRSTFSCEVKLKLASNGRLAGTRLFQYVPMLSKCFAGMLSCTSF